MIKSFTTIAFASIFATLACHADVTDKLIGKWAGSATATNKGAAVSQQVLTVYKRFEKKGLVATTTIKIDGLPPSVGVSRFHDNGKVEGELKRNGSVVAVISGTWTVTNKTLKSNVKAEGIFPTFRISSKVTLVTANRINLAGSTSTGEYSVGSLKRK